MVYKRQRSDGFEDSSCDGCGLDGREMGPGELAVPATCRLCHDPMDVDQALVYLSCCRRTPAAARHFACEMDYLKNDMKSHYVGQLELTSYMVNDFLDKCPMCKTEAYLSKMMQPGVARSFEELVGGYEMRRRALAEHNWEKLPEPVTGSRRRLLYEQLRQMGDIMETCHTRVEKGRDRILREFNINPDKSISDQLVLRCVELDWPGADLTREKINLLYGRFRGLYDALFDDYEDDVHLPLYHISL